MAKQQSQIAQQFRQQLYPMIEKLHNLHDQVIEPSSVRQRRKVNKAAYFLENGLDLIDKAFSPQTKTKQRQQQTVENGERSEWPQGEERQSSYRRQPQQTEMG